MVSFIAHLTNYWLYPAEYFLGYSDHTFAFLISMLSSRGLALGGGTISSLSGALSRLSLLSSSGQHRAVFLQLQAPFSTQSNLSSQPVQTSEYDNSVKATKRSSITMTDSVVRRYVPRTPGVRHLVRPINDHLWKGGPFRALTFPKKGMAKGGRNNTGRITVRHRGGGAKRRIRTVDFRRMEWGKHLIERIEYDPNRSAHIALVTHQGTGKKSYILAADSLRAGDVVESFRKGLPVEVLEELGGTAESTQHDLDPGLLAARITIRGNCLPMHMIPVGAQIFNISATPLGHAVFCRSAGTFATVVSKGDSLGANFNHVTVRLQSGELRKIPRNACATIGVASNVNWHLRQLGKAGRSRWLNIRPTVRGLAMNAVDHPHGGGRGKSKGNRLPTSPWGTLAKCGFKTRNRPISRLVVQQRPRKKDLRSGK